MIATELEVEYVLRNLHSDRLLRSSAIAGRLQRIFSAKSLYEAVVHAVESTFRESGTDPDMAHLRDILYVNDIEQAVPRGAAAKAQGVSARTFYRKRKRAIRLIVEHINTLLKSGEDVNGRFRAYLQARATEVPLETREFVSDPRTADLSFKAWEASSQSFHAGRLTGDLFLMKHSIAALTGHRTRLARPNALELLIMEAELRVYEGLFFDASRILESAFEQLSSSNIAGRVWLLALFVRAQLAFAIGNLSDAGVLADTVAESASDWLRTAAVALSGRISIATGTPWDQGAAIPRTEWEALSLTSVQSRIDLLAASHGRAYDTALESRERSLACGFLPLATYAAATMAACHDVAQSRQRGAATVYALRLLAAGTSNALVARDLFQFGPPVEPSSTWLDESRDEDLAAIYFTLTPATIFTTFSLRKTVPLLLRCVFLRMQNLDHTSGYRTIMEDLAVRINRVEQIPGSFSDELQRLAAFGEFLKVVVPILEQPTFARDFAMAAGVVLRALARSKSYHSLRALAVVS